MADIEDHIRLPKFVKLYIFKEIYDLLTKYSILSQSCLKPNKIVIEYLNYQHFFVAELASSISRVGVKLKLYSVFEKLQILS